MYKIAVTDDEPKILKGITELLRKRLSGKAEVISFQNPSVLLEYAQENEVDILITDICMPDMDGLELSAKLRMKYPLLKIIIISGYSRFDYAKTAISLQVCEYILKPVDQEKLISVIEQAIQDLDSTSSALAHQPESSEGNQKHYETMLLRAIRYGDQESLQWLRHFGFEGCAMVFAVLEFTEQDGLDGTELYQALYRELQPTGYHQLFLQVGPLRFLWVLPQEEQFREKLEEFLTWQNECEIKCSIGISRPVIDCGEIQQGYRQALNAAKQELYYQGNRIYDYHPVPESSCDTEKTALSILRHLLSSEFEKADRETADLFLRFAQDKTPVSDLRRILEELIGQFEPVLRHNGITKEDYEEIKIQLDLIDRYHVLADLEADFNVFLSKIKEKMTVVKNLRLEQNLDQAIEYINTHFDQDLSLEEVAEHANLNASYFSTTFKKYTGSNFVTYLMNLRIDHAKRLLRDPSCKILQIAQESGFHDTRYFAKTFKKNVGITPSEYRNIVLQLNKESE